MTDGEAIVLMQWQGRLIAVRGYAHDMRIDFEYTPISSWDGWQDYFYTGRRDLALEMVIRDLVTIEGTFDDWWATTNERATTAVQPALPAPTPALEEPS